MSGVHVVPVDAAEREHREARRRRVLWVVGAAVLMLAVAVQPLRDTDVWWHLALGRLIAAHGIPAQEPFSFLHAAYPWVGQQWLYEVLLAGLYGAGGAGLASIVMGLAAVAALVVAALAVPRAARVSGVWLAIAIMLSGFVMAQLVGVRGQVLSILGTAIVLYVVTRWREGRTALVWLLPPLFLLWANLHAGFIVGFVILALALVLARPLQPAASLDRRALLAASLASVVVTLANPAGFALYGYVAATFGNPTLTQLVTEWSSPDFHNVWLQLFEAQAVLLVVLWAAAGKLDRFDAALAVLALVASLQAQRNVSLFAIVVLPQIATYGARAWQRHAAPRMRRRRVTSRDRQLRGIGGAAAIAAIAAAVAATLVPRLTPASAADFEATRYPKAAADYVAVHRPGERLYSPDVWGGYLAYRFPTGRVVFLYDETAIFGNTALQRYLDIHLLRDNWADVLRAEGIQLAVVSDSSQEASAFHELGWSVACHDGLSGSLVMVAPAQPVLAVAHPLSLTGAPAC